MEATARARIQEQRQQQHPDGPASPWPNEDMTARSLARFVEEARSTLERIDRFQARNGAGRPEIRERREILRALAMSEERVDVLDLRPSRRMTRDARRRLVRAMAEENQVEIESNGTYPNMLRLRITSQGRETLRRYAAEEAMGILTGEPGEVYRAVAEARRAIRELDARIAAGTDGR